MGRRGRLFFGPESGRLVWIAVVVFAVLAGLLVRNGLNARLAAAPAMR